MLLFKSQDLARLKAEVKASENHIREKQASLHVLYATWDRLSAMFMDMCLCEIIVF